MKIAALIRTHHRPDLLKLLIDRLSAGPLWSTYIHVNRSSDIRQFAGVAAPQHFLRQRVTVHWAGYSMISATLRLLEAALEDPSNTHFFVMSGQDYLMRSDEEIASALAGFGDGNLITSVTMPQDHKPLDRLDRWHFRDNPILDGHRLRGRLKAAAPHRDVGKLLRGFAPYGGTAWWLLSRPAVEAMMTFLRYNDWFKRAFRFSSFADEMFFQTLFLNLGFEADNGHPTASKWTPGASRPETITPEVYAELRTGWHFAARKFDDFHPAIACASGPEASPVARVA